MNNKRLRSMTVRVAAVVGVALTLGGCLVVPAGPGYWHRPYRYYYY